jgi:3-oxoacyl-[acyl-carrier protein] reductase
MYALAPLVSLWRTCRRRYVRCWAAVMVSLLSPGMPRPAAADGYAAAIAYLCNTAEAGEPVESITGKGGRAISVQADVADETEAEQALGGLDVVVSAAGIMPMAPLDLSVLGWIYRTNIHGMFAVSQQAARRLRGGGAIINFSSSGTRLAIPGYGAYAASKGAVEALPLILARELRGRDIAVSTVAPGPTATALFFEGKDQAAIDRAAGFTPLERPGTPADIAEAVAFLAGPGPWVNGQVIYANGGA